MLPPEALALRWGVVKLVLGMCASLLGALAGCGSAFDAGSGSASDASPDPPSDAGDAAMDAPDADAGLSDEPTEAPGFVLCSTVRDGMPRVFACGDGWRADYDAQPTVDAGFTMTLYSGASAGQPLPVASCDPSVNTPVHCPPDGGGPLNGVDCSVDVPGEGRFDGYCLTP